MITSPSQGIHLRKPIIFSAIVHLMLLVAISVAPHVSLPFRDRPIRIQMMWVELPRGTSDDIGLGMKKAEGLPKSTIEEQKKLFRPEEPQQEPLAPKMKEPEGSPPKSEEKKEGVKRPEMEIPSKMKVRRAEEKPRGGGRDQKIRNALAKIDRQLKNRQITPEMAQIKEGSDGYKYGTGTKPLRALPSDPEYLKYQAMVRAKIIHEWIVPLRYTEEGGGIRNASIEVLINTDGDVVSVRWISPSGDSSFDQSAVRAVKKASPFPKPPDRLAWEAYNEGFLIEFDTRLKPQY